MGEIKFRAWDRLENKMRYDAYVTFYQPKGTVSWGGYMINMQYLMQYTGLKDKNGKEIYEGDLLKYLPIYPRDYQERNPLKKHGRIAGPVTWEKGWLWVDYRPQDYDGTLLYDKETESWEVIGNIYENPELLSK